MLHLQEDWYLKGATRRKTSKFNLHSLGVGTPSAKCTSRPEGTNEMETNWLSRAPVLPTRGPLGPRSQRENVYRLNQINTSGPLRLAGCFISSLQSRRLVWVCLRTNSRASRFACMCTRWCKRPYTCLRVSTIGSMCVRVCSGMCPCVCGLFSVEWGRQDKHWGSFI